MYRAKILAVLGCFALTASLLLVTSSPAAAVSSSSYESQINSLTNYHRTKRDLVKVKRQSCVDRYAERQARWMASHQSLKHQDLRTVLKACKLTEVSENIAVGFSSGNKTVLAWMRSKGHKRNIIRSKMRYIGAGAYKDDNGRWWVSQVFGTRK